MPRAQSTAQANKILREREDEALAELEKLGFRTTLHELGEHVDADPLRGIAAGYRPGVCYAVQYAVDGRRKHVAGVSAVECLSHAASWVDWQARLKPDSPQKFVPSPANAPTPEAFVRHELAGDTARTAARRKNTERRVIALEGAPRLVDAHGDELSDETTRAARLA